MATVVLVLAGCAPTPSGDTPNPTTSTSTMVISGSDVNPQQPGEEFEEWKSFLADRFRLENPPQDVEFERYTSPDEYAAVMVPCLTEQGIPARSLPDGGVTIGEMPEDQWILANEAMYRCLVRFPTHPRYTEPPTEDQIRLIYEYWTGELAECLENEGYPVSQPPTFPVFLASYGASGVEQWHPYPEDDPRLQDPDEWYRLNEVCPQSLPTEVLYPDP
jgi:hypothetical protein